MSIPISIVIPLFNKEKYIQRAIQSVLAQTYPNFELIIVDDGSTDGSFEAANEIKDPRIRIIRQDNAGESAARNRGVAEAQYDWVAFLDADDEWKNEYLEQMTGLINWYPNCEVFGCSYETTTGRGEPLNNCQFLPNSKGILNRYLKYLRSCIPFNSSSVIIRKITLIAVGGFPNGVKNGGDIDTWIRLSLVTKIAYINRPLVVYHDEICQSAGKGYDWQQEYYPAKALRQIVSNRKLEKEFREDSIEYIAQKDLKTSIALFRGGKPLHAIYYLWFCRGTKIYRRKILKTIIEELPASLVKMVIRKSSLGFITGPKVY